MSAPATNLSLVGPMGAGKSSIGRRLAARFGLAFVDADAEIERRCGATIPTIFECEGEAGFRDRERAVIAALLERDGLLLATGGGAVLDVSTRERLRMRSFVVHLHAGVEQQLARLARDRSRPLLAGGDRREVLGALAEARAPLYAEAAHLRFDTDGHALADAVARLAREIDARWRLDAAGDGAAA